MSIFIIKMIALTTMIIDHIASATGSTMPFYYVFRGIGRISFMLYAFLVAEGCRHTKNMKKYMIRLFVFAIISEIPFDMCFGQMKNSVWENQNIFFTLCFAVSGIYFYEKIRTIEGGKWRYLELVPIFAAMGIAYLLKTDYSYMGVFTIYMIYTGKTKITQMMGVLAGLLITNYDNFYWNISILSYSVPAAFFLISFGSLALIPIYYYNGELGPKMKYLFYIAYPAHIILIYIFRDMLFRL